jgi:hypothetical protein
MLAVITASLTFLGAPPLIAFDFIFAFTCGKREPLERVFWLVGCAMRYIKLEMSLSKLNRVLFPIAYLE